MKKIIKVILFVLTSNSFFGQDAPFFQWTKQIGAAVPGSASGEAVYVDVLGNLYTAGFFGSVTDFDPGPGVFTLSPVGQEDAFVCKFDAAGNFLWVGNFGSIGTDHANSIAVDASGNVYFGGYFEYTADFDPSPSTFTLTSNGQQDAFIAKLNSSGALVWAKQFGGPLYEYGFSVKLDASNNVYYTTYLKGTVDVDPGPSVFNMTSLGPSDALICKLDQNGNFIWAKQFGGTGYTSGSALAIDPTGDICINGSFTSITDFDPSAGVYTLAPIGQMDGYVAKLNSNGVLVWAKQFGGIGSNVSEYSIATDQNANIYTTGYFNGAVDFDPGISVTSLTANVNNTFISKIDINGNFGWSKQLVSSSNNGAASVRVDMNSNVYIVGGYSGVADFDPGPSVKSFAYSGGTGSDVFIEKLDVNGNYNWSAQFGEYSTDLGNSIFIDGSNNVYATGSFNGVVDFDPNVSTYTLTGSSDAFLLKYGQCTVPLPPTDVTPQGNLLVCGPATTTLFATGSGTISWFGNPVGGGSIGTGTSIVTVTLPLGVYTYYAEAATCTVSSSRAAISVSVVSCASTKEQIAENKFFSIYPNPSNGIYYFDIRKPSTVTVKNILGEVILIDMFEAGKQTIDLKNFKDNIYLLRVENEEQHSSFILLKE